MALHTDTTITYTDADTGITVPLPFSPVDGEVYVIDNGQRVTFLTHDEWPMDYDFPEGVVFRETFSGEDDLSDWIETMESNGCETFIVGRYEHGMVSFCVHGERTYPNMAWDYGWGGAIAIPNDFTDPLTAASVILEEYTDWCNGSVYSVVSVNVNDPDDYYCCGGFIGYAYAIEVAKAGDI
jgi:hypothetical protein